MGGTSSTSQTQSSTTAPWTQAQPALQGILGQLQPQIANSGLNGAESGAINQLTQNASGTNPYAGQIGANATSLLNGGGAMNQAGNVQSGLSALQGQLSPYANPGYSSLNNPALQAALQQIQSDTSNSVNSQFAGAGRDLSGANQMALGRGIAAGEAPLILNQFNQDTATQQGAANSLYNAQNNTSGLLSGMQQQANSNGQAGTQAANDAFTAQNRNPQATLTSQLLGQQIPAQNLGLLAQIGTSIAGLGSQSTGQSNGTQTASGLTQFQQLMSGLGSKGGTAANGATTGGSGLLGLLGL